MTPGERRPREGRCARCDRPLTDEVYEQWVSAWPHADPPAVPPPAVFGWSEQESNETHCIGGLFCISDPPDWKARALAAEAALDAQRKATTFLCVEYDAMRNDLAELVACRCGEEWTARGLHAPECHADEGYLDHRDPSGALADAEARGRAHGLLAAALVLDAESDWCEGAARNARLARDMDGVRRNEYRHLAILQVMDEITALAEEADRG